MDGVAGVRRPDAASVQQAAQVLRGGDLAGMRAGRDEVRIEGGAGAEHRLQAHDADDVGRQDEPPRVREGQAPDAGHQLRAVEQRQPLLGLQHERLEPGSRQDLAAAARAGAVDGRLALADEHERQVGQRGEVARTRRRCRATGSPGGPPR